MKNLNKEKGESAISGAPNCQLEKKIGFQTLVWLQVTLKKIESFIANIEKRLHHERSIKWWSQLLVKVCL